MRIALIVYGDLSVRSGGNLYDEILVSALRQRDHVVEILSLPPRGSLGGLWLNASIAAHRALLSQLRNGQFDLVLQDELIHASLFLWNHRVRAEADAPLVGIVHHLKISEWRPSWRRRAWSLIERRYLRGLDAFIFNSKTTRDAVLHEVGPSDKPFIVATPGGDRLCNVSPKETGSRELSRKLRLLFVGNLIPRKGVHDLLEALGRIRPTDVSLELVGSMTTDPAYVSRLRRLVTEYGLTDNVRFLGAVDEAQLAARLEASDLLVVPSHYEGFGIVLLEALSFARPVLACRSGAMPEIIEHDANGLLVAPGAPPQLAAAVTRLIEEDGLVARLGAGAKRSYRRFPRWQESMERAANFLEARLVNQSKTR